MIIGIDRLGESPLRVGLVKSFIENEVTMANSDGSSSSSLTHILMNIQWYENHPRRDYINSSVILTCTVFDHDSCASFIPVSRVFSRCTVSSPITLQFNYGEDNIIVAIPLRTEH